MIKTLFIVWLFVTLLLLYMLFIGNENISNNIKIGVTIGLVAIGLIAISQSLIDIIYFYIKKD